MTTKTATKSATIDTVKLREALVKVNFIQPSQKLSILGNVLIELANGKATLTTTDMERVVRVTIDADIESGDFSLLLPRKQLASFLYGANGKVHISQTPRNVILSREGLGNLTLATDKIADFPPNLPKADKVEWHSFDGKWLCKMLSFVANCCADEDTRPILTGVAFNDGAIAAADGFRLAVLKDDRLGFGLGNKQAIIPHDTIILLSRLFTKTNSIEIAFETGQQQEADKIRRIHIKSDDTTLTSETIQGTYPNYSQLIPNRFNCKATFSAPLLSQRLAMIDAKQIPSGIVRYVVRQLDKGEQVCDLLSGYTEDDIRNEYSLSLPVKIESDQPSKIAFQHKYIAEAIKPFSVCNLELSSQSSPGKITGDIEGLMILVMPMFVQW